MFCKWCGGVIKETDSSCKSCGKETVRLSQRGGDLEFLVSPTAKKGYEKGTKKLQVTIVLLAMTSILVLMCVANIVLVLRIQDKIDFLSENLSECVEMKTTSTVMEKETVAVESEEQTLPEDAEENIDGTLEGMETTPAETN